MHKAPSVSYPVGPCLWYERMVWSAYGAVLCAFAWVFWAGSAPPWGVVLSTSALGLGLGLALWQHFRHPLRGHLTWSTQEGVEVGQWWWHAEVGPALAVRVSCVWHSQQALCLRLSPPTGPDRWVWALARTDAAQWLALRRAVLAHPPVA